MMAEAQQRKERSLVKAVAHSVPCHVSLPCIESEAECCLRTKVEVVQRAWALYIVLAKAFEMEEGPLNELIEDLGARSWLSPKELEFIEPRRGAFVSNQDEILGEQRTRFSWRYESLSVILWSLGFIHELSIPDAQCDVEVIEELFSNNDPADFEAKANLRTPGEILDEADLIYRYHWATTQARLEGKESPAGLDSGIVYERHYALNWLIGYQDQPWDAVTTDT